MYEIWSLGAMEAANYGGNWQYCISAQFTPKKRPQQIYLQLVLASATGIRGMVVDGTTSTEGLSRDELPQHEGSTATGFLDQLSNSPS